MRGPLAVMVLLALALAAAASPPKLPERAGVLVRCSPTVAEPVRLAAEDFMATRPEVRVCVLPASSDRAWKAVADGTADLGIAARHAEGSGLKREPVGREGLAFVVHPSNPVGGLSLSQLRDLFSGRDRSWDRVGGPREPVHVLATDTNSGHYDILKNQVLGAERALSPEVRWLAPGRMRRAVADDPLAIGFLSLPEVGPGVKVLAVEGVPPTLETVRTRKYPVHRELELLIAEHPSRNAGDFARHLVQTEKGDRFFSERLMVPLP